MRILPRLTTLVLAHWQPLALALGAGALHIIFQLLPPLFIRDGLAILSGRDGYIATSIALAIILLLISNAARSFLFLVSNQMGHVAGYRMVRDLRLDVYRHLQLMTPSFYARSKTGTLVAKVVNDVEQMELFVAHALLQLFTTLVMVVGIAVIMVLINPLLALVALLPIPPLIIVAVVYAKKMQANYRDLRRSLGDMAAALQDNLSGMMVIQAFTRERTELERLRTKTDHLYGHFVRASWLFHASFPLIEFLGGLGTVLVLWMGAQALGGVPLEDLVIFFLYLRYFYQPISQIGQINDQVQNALASAERIFEVLDTDPEIQDRPGVKAPVSVRWDLAFDDVHFSYGPDGEVLRGVSFVAREGEMVAIVGPSGAGKTTITKLIGRFHDPEAGQVQIGGHDLRSLPLDFIRSNISLVLQDVFLFDGTVRENLLVGRADATEDEVIAAAQAANAHEFIAQLPLGYETRVGERGVLLSGGQKQRLSIARALLKDAPILVLDEATSSVDTASEALIQQALNRLAGGGVDSAGLTRPRRTSIVVAHRLSTIKHADRIIVLSDGRIVEEGTHDYLLVAGGLYSELYNAQLRRQEWELVE
jgi:ATP-binding cassette, subfamily B, bacterial